MQLELDFENKHLQYTDGMLISSGKILCKDSAEFKGKRYWGNGHTSTLADFYVNNSAFSLSDIKGTMKTRKKAEHERQRRLRRGQAGV